jgi:cell division protein FtsW (lipid II flippase)
VTATISAKRRGKPPSTPLPRIQRIEGGAIAALAVVAFMLAGFPWWWLLALFVVFDLSAIGYTVSNRAGAIGYNLVHNYAAPAILASAYLLLLATGLTSWPLAFAAGCWFFHVGVDRAIGYGPRPTRTRANTHLDPYEARIVRGL